MIVFVLTNSSIEKKITSKKENVQNIFIIGRFYTMKHNKLVAYLSERTKFYGREVDTRLFTIFLMVLFKCILGIKKKEIACPNSKTLGNMTS